MDEQALARARNFLTLELAVQSWLETVLGVKAISAKGAHLSDQLHDGTLLCNFANALYPGVIKASKMANVSDDPEKLISYFIRACKKMRVPSSACCDVRDLYEQRNMPLFLNMMKRLSACVEERDPALDTLNEFDGSAIDYSPAELARAHQLVQLASSAEAAGEASAAAGAAAAAVARDNDSHPLELILEMMDEVMGTLGNERAAIADWIKRGRQGADPTETHIQTLTDTFGYALTFLGVDHNRGGAEQKDEREHERKVKEQAGRIVSSGKGVFAIHIRGQTMEPALLKVKAKSVKIALSKSNSLRPSDRDLVLYNEQLTPDSKLKIMFHPREERLLLIDFGDGKKVITECESKLDRDIIHFVVQRFRERISGSNTLDVPDS